ncbi:MAG: hypothetical protein B7Z73_19895, partial [Planctomycetia bacterium 21-64-5]
MMLMRLLRPAGQTASYQLDRQRQELEAWLGEFFGLAGPARIEEHAQGGLPDDLAAPGPTAIAEATLYEVASWFPGMTVEEVRARFRPNLEIGGAPAFFEDQLSASADEVVDFAIGEARLSGTNPCQRCVVPSRWSLTGEVGPERDFAKTFAELRRRTLRSTPGRRTDAHARYGSATKCVSWEGDAREQFWISNRGWRLTVLGGRFTRTRLLGLDFLCRCGGRDGPVGQLDAPTEFFGQEIGITASVGPLRPFAGQLLPTHAVVQVPGCRLGRALVHPAGVELGQQLGHARLGGERFNPLDGIRHLRPWLGLAVFQADARHSDVPFLVRRDVEHASASPAHPLSTAATSGTHASHTHASHAHLGQHGRGGEGRGQAHIQRLAAFVLDEDAGLGRILGNEPYGNLAGIQRLEHLDRLVVGVVLARFGVPARRGCCLLGRRCGGRDGPVGQL